MKRKIDAHIWLDEQDHRIILAAAQREALPVTAFIRAAAIKAARKLVSSVEEAAK